MNLGFPHREALVVRGHELRVIRHLSGNPDVRVRAGERITAEHVIARTDPAATAIKIPIADQLGIGPHDVAKCLMRPVGSNFAAGEGLARARKGLRNVVVASPAAGILLSLDSATGVASFAPMNGNEVTSLIAGDVEFVDGRQVVSIRTVGSRVLGIVGLGNAARGPIKVVTDRPDQEVAVNRITPDLAGSIVVGGSWASAAVLKRLVEVKANGLITGGLVEKEIAASLGLQTEDRLSPWRLGPADRSLGENLTLNLAVMATEGFGQLAMHPEAFALFQEMKNRDAVLFPRTRVTGQLTRPEVIIPDLTALDDDGLTSHAVFAAGARVRLTDHASLGKVATIDGGPRRARYADGLMLDVVDVEIASGAKRPVPVSNVEIVA